MKTKLFILLAVLMTLGFTGKTFGMEITVIIPQLEKAIYLDVSPYESVASIKSRIEKSEHIYTGNQILSYQNVPLNVDSWSLSDYGIREFAKLYLTIRTDTKSLTPLFQFQSYSAQFSLPTQYIYKP